MKYKKQYIIALLLLILAIINLSSSTKKNYNEEEIIKIYKKALLLLKNNEKASSKKALGLLKIVFDSEYQFNAKSYNTTVKLLDKNLKFNENTIRKFMSTQKGFFQNVTIPYYLVSKGNYFNVNSLLVYNKTTILYFTAPWCMFCKRLRKPSKQLVKDKKYIKIREIDLLGTQTSASDEFKRLHRTALHKGVFTPVIFIYKNNTLQYSGLVQPFLDKMIK